MTENISGQLLLVDSLKLDFSCPMDLWVRRELEITCQDRRSIWGTREVRDTAAFDHKEGKIIFWEHLSGNFAQSYGRCDAARRYGVQSCPKGMSDLGSTVRVQYYGGRMA
jgi:hypothetical protein